MKKPIVIVTRRLPEATETRMKELFDVRLNADDHRMNADELKAAVARANVLVPTVTDVLDRAVLDAAGPDFKLIANFGSGTDHVDVAYAQSRGITVTNTPDVLTEDTAEMTMALLLAVPRRLIEGDRLVRAGKWVGWGPTTMLGSRVSGKRLGIIGMGRIGQAVAERARGFGMSIHYHNRRRLHPSVEDMLEATYWDDLDQMLPRMDVISIHCPGTPQTRHLLNRRRLELMRPTSYLVNTARGYVVDEDALLEMLASRRIAGAALDVFENEPAVDPRFVALDNVVLMPHLGAATHEARQEMGQKVLINIKTFVDGHRPPDRVLPHH
ncbi:Glyoxylate reductase [uncultured Alphaproteobacteria bacterium]|uniref:Glyoxylate reductase n=1 Tax=uncultured Alphaproteobacteria bacterium TaxID=91750 RepID=A0A212K9H0_9PROT|nr:Glyoxylate reductase [uncultured Alphaproteobacteria bacterium]